MCVFLYEVQLQTPDSPQVSIIPRCSLPSVFENKVKPPIASILPAALIEPHYVYIVQINVHSICRCQQSNSSCSAGRIAMTVNINLGLLKDASHPSLITTTENNYSAVSGQLCTFLSSSKSCCIAVISFY